MSADRTTGAVRWDALAVGVKLNPVPDSITVNADVTAEIEGDDGVSATVTLVAGGVYPYRPSKVISGAGIVGLYNARQ